MRGKGGGPKTYGYGTCTVCGKPCVVTMRGLVHSHKLEGRPCQGGYRHPSSTARTREELLPQLPVTG